MDQSYHPPKFDSLIMLENKHLAKKHWLALVLLPPVTSKRRAFSRNRNTDFVWTSLERLAIASMNWMNNHCRLHNRICHDAYKTVWCSFKGSGRGGQLAQEIYLRHVTQTSLRTHPVNGHLQPTVFVQAKAAQRFCISPWWYFEYITHQQEKLKTQRLKKVVKHDCTLRDDPKKMFAFAFGCYKLRL